MNPKRNVCFHLLHMHTGRDPYNECTHSIVWRRLQTHDVRVASILGLIAFADGGSVYTAHTSLVGSSSTLYSGISHRYRSEQDKRGPPS